jgi:hypothetical protein
MRTASRIRQSAEALKRKSVPDRKSGPLVAIGSTFKPLGVSSMQHHLVLPCNSARPLSDMK